MTVTETTTETLTQDADEASALDNGVDEAAVDVVDVVDEVLVEEISIDGMCGVY